MVIKDWGRHYSCLETSVSPRLSIKDNNHWLLDTKTTHEPTSLKTMISSITLERRYICHIIQFQLKFGDLPRCAFLQYIITIFVLTTLSNFHYWWFRIERVMFSHCLAKTVVQPAGGDRTDFTVPTKLSVMSMVKVRQI